jgi:transcriptional regulator with XRE-family HTH domain
MADLTQKDLAKKTGLSQSTIAQIEKGLKAPSLTTLYKLEKVLGQLWISP